MNRPRTLGIWGNSQKPAFWEYLPQIMTWAESFSLDVFLTTHIVKRLDDKPVYTYHIIESAEDFHKLDFILALGGDGTILSLARAVAQRNTRGIARRAAGSRPGDFPENSCRNSHGGNPPRCARLPAYSFVLQRAPRPMMHVI